MQKSTHHICILCSRLDTPGGIERAIVNTANLLDDNGIRVTLLIADSVKSSFYDLNKEIRIVQEPLHFGISNTGNVFTRKVAFFRHLSALKKLFKSLRPDVIIGTEYSFSIAAHLAAQKLNIPVFAWEHHHFHWLKKSRFWNLLFYKYYPRLTGVIFLNDAEEKLFKQAGCKTFVIPNFIHQKNKASLRSKALLSVGWLIKRKGVDLIPFIAENIFTKHPDWKWIVIGTGEEELSLRNDLQKRNLNEHVSIVAPSSSDLEAQYLDSSTYVMTSRFECFPMVLLEAMAHGVPAISFDCPTGPSFIINHGVDGVLIPGENVNQMTNAILTLIEDENMRKSFGENAYENVNRFSPDKVYELWQNLLAQYRSER